MNAEAIKEAAALTQEAVDLYFKGYYDEARSLLARSIALAPRVSRPHAAMALCLAQLGNARDGLDYAEKAVVLDGASAVALTTRAFCLHRLGDDGRAVTDFERAVELDPGDFRVWYNFACHWAERGEEEKCREILTTALDLAPGHFAGAVAADPDLGRYSQTAWFKELLARLKGRMK
jgi:tetratricopeptide (TPR) repeat protein